MLRDSEIISIPIPGTEYTITEGSKVRIGRFESTIWVAHFGWYSWGGNRPVCGWYLVDSMDAGKIKPLQQPDLYDCYYIEN